MLKAEPLVFSALRPLLSGKKARYQRSLMVQKYCSGHGAEIGGLQQPVLVPRGARTSYIDRVSADYWRSLPGNAAADIVTPDIIDEGETLSTVADNSFDYLIAAHVLEHVEDAIAALKTWLRVVKPGGHLIIAVPDMRFCGEEHRSLTSIEHFIRDHEEGPHVSKKDHHREFGIHLKGYSGERLEAYVEKAEPMIHFHTFTLASFAAFLAALEPVGFDLLEVSFNVNEDLAVLRKRN